MPFITFEGQTIYIPGVYSAVTVEQDSAGPLPEFMVPIILGGADEGHPYNADDLKYDDESPFTPFKRLNTTSAVASYYGPSSDVTTAMKYAKRVGYPGGWFACLSALTRASVIAQSAGPVDQLTLYSKKFGAPGGHIKLKVAGGNSVEVTPLKHYSLITATANNGQKRVYVKDNSWVVIGSTVSIGGTGKVNADYVVANKGTELDANGQEKFWIDLTTNLAIQQTTAAYSMVVQYDTAGVEKSGTLATLEAQYQWFQGTSEFIGAKKEATFNGATAALVALAAATPLKDITAWGAATAGASPEPTSTEYTDFISDMDAVEWDAFLAREKVIPRMFYLVDPSSTVHASFRDWAVAKRSEGFPIFIVTGCEWGDTDLAAGGDTNPTVRLAALDSQDVMLACGGLDKLAPYLTLAAKAFGYQCSKGPRHNLTNDDLKYTEVEKKWDERNSGELTKLLKAGALTYKVKGSRPYNFVIAEGLTSLQNNAKSWNVGTNDTPLAQQRHLADFVNRALTEDLDGTQLGADETTPDSIAATYLLRRDSLLKRGYITSAKITSITLNESQTGYDLDHTVKLPTTVDFITFRTRILTAEAG